MFKQGARVHMVAADESIVGFLLDAGVRSVAQGLVNKLTAASVSCPRCPGINVSEVFELCRARPCERPPPECPELPWVSLALLAALIFCVGVICGLLGASCAAGRRTSPSSPRPRRPSATTTMSRQPVPRRSRAAPLRLAAPRRPSHAAHCWQLFSLYGRMTYVR